MFDLSKVTSVYSGRIGCACGCRGKYSYASNYKSARPSYMTGDEGINDRSVKTIVNKVEKILRDPNADLAEIYFDSDFVAINMGDKDRCYTIYFA